MQKQIEINGRKYLCVVVPKDATEFGIISTYGKKGTKLCYKVDCLSKYDLLPKNITPIPKILGTLDTISEDQSKSVVGEIDTPSGSTPDYRGLLLKEYYKDLTAYRFDESIETILIIQINELNKEKL